MSNQITLRRIISCLELEPTDQVVEIGPGLGALTRYLLDSLNQLFAIELDERLLPYLRSLPKLTVVQSDALKFNYNQFRDLRLVGNLAYNIATEMIFLLNSLPNLKDAHFMVQKEVALRLTAATGTAAYSRTSLMVQYFYNVSSLFYVPPEDFSPPPKVDSAFIRLVPKEQKLALKSFKNFDKLLKLAFAHRRKTLLNNLKPFLKEEYLSLFNLQHNTRAQELSLADYVRLANLLPESQ